MGRLFVMGILRPIKSCCLQWGGAVLLPVHVPACGFTLTFHAWFPLLRSFNSACVTGSLGQLCK